MNSVLNEALNLRAQNYWVVTQKGKCAYTPAWNTQEIDEQLLRQEASKPGINIAIVTGQSRPIDGHRLAVLDCDVRGGEQYKKDAYQAARSMIGDLKPTTKTGGGGAHWFLAIPDSKFPSENKLVLAQGTEVEIDGKLKPAWTIELLANGHACTVPPSIHPNGKQYAWVNGGAHAHNAPSSLFEAIERARQQNADQRAHTLLSVLAVPGQGLSAALEPLPTLPAVQQLKYEGLPTVLRAYVQDIAERMQCPPDFPAVACIAMVGAAIGRKVGIRPKRADNWTVPPNQWVMIIGRSGILKTPAQSAALQPMRKMQGEAFKAHERAEQEHEVRAKISKIQTDEAERAARAMMKDGKETEARLELEKAQRSVEDAPTVRRLLINDSTVEALAETLEENPNGVLVDRDELSGWLRSLDKEGQQEARAFYLTAADGDKGFTTDRIGRGRGRHIAAVCVSIVGTIQPGVLASYVRETQRGGSGDDGLLQRFGLMVYPDISREWKNVDRAPNQEARRAVDALVMRLCELDPESIGAEVDPYQPIPFLRFDDAAQSLFDEWREDLETNKIRSDDEHPAVVSHLSKYRKLVPGLALINHLCEGGGGPVPEEALARALSMADYLESHARRVYSYASRPDVDGAKTIVAKIRNGKLGQTFKARDIYRNGWSGLSTPEETWPAIRLLVDYGYLIESKDADTGGRPSQTFLAHPSIAGGA